MNLDKLTALLNQQREMKEEDLLVKKGVDENEPEDNKTIFYNIANEFKSRKVNRKNSVKKLVVLMNDLFSVDEELDDDAIF